MSTENVSDKLLDERLGSSAPTTVPPTTVALPPTTEPTVPPTTVAIIPSTEAPTTQLPGETTVTGSAPAPATTTTAEDLTAIESTLRKMGVLKEGQTLEDLKEKPSEDQILLQKKEDRDAAVKFALDNGSLKVEDYEGYVLDSSKQASELAFEKFKEAFLEDTKGSAEEGTYADEDIREMFDKRKYGEKEMKRMADAFLLEKYGDVHNDGIINNYKNFQEQTKKATEYKSIVESSLNVVENEGLVINIEGMDILYKPSKEVVEQIRTVYSDLKSFQALGGNITQESLQEAIKLNIKSNEFNKIVTEVAQSYHAAQLKQIKLGRQGIDAIHNLDTGGDDGGAKGSTSVADSKIEQAKKR